MVIGPVNRPIRVSQIDCRCRLLPLDGYHFTSTATVFMTPPADPPADLRVMHVLVGEAWGGAERFFVKLAGALHARGLNQKVVIKRDDKRAGELRAVGVEPLQFNFSKGPGDIFARMGLNRAIKSYRPHVITVWMNRAARRVPKGDYTVVGRLGGYYKLRHYRNCDWLIGNTPDLVDYIKREGWPPDRVAMISNFGELEAMPPVDRAMLETPDNAFVALAMGRFHPSKGFDTLIDAVAEAPHVHLWLAGDGDLDQALRRQVAARGVADRVRFLGWRDDQAALLAACDVCVVPSRHEPLSNVTLEAWSLGVPVIAAASEGPSWLIEDGVTGLLTPVDDAAALTVALKRLGDDLALRDRLAEAGNVKWWADFSKDAICDQYLRFFANTFK